MVSGNETETITTGHFGVALDLLQDFCQFSFKVFGPIIEPNYLEGKPKREINNLGRPPIRENYSICAC
jgi:hypothetical protein